MEGGGGKTKLGAYMITALPTQIELTCLDGGNSALSHSDCIMSSTFMDTTFKPCAMSLCLLGVVS